jgi:hypothetical protein
MEEKIVGEKEGSSLLSDISFALLSIAFLSSVFVYTAPALDLPPHSGVSLSVMNQRNIARLSNGSCFPIAVLVLWF